MTDQQQKTLEQAKTLISEGESKDSFSVWSQGISLLRRVMSRTLVKDLLQRRAEVDDKFGKFARKSLT